jgi:type VI secretion system protein ImpE
MNTPEEFLAAGDPHSALELLHRQVRERPADVKLRVFLFQLLCVLGQWQRALNQLQVCGEMDAGALPMVNTYREALHCEAVREAVFAGNTTPMVFGQPQVWLASLAEALQAQARGDDELASRLREGAFEMAPATTGSINGIGFEWLADADSRLGPVLEVVINGKYGWMPFASLTSVTIEPPSDLRDLVWAPAHLGFANGGETVALIPTRYCGSGEQADAALLMARKTEWLPIGPEQYRGLGQRVLSTDIQELGLLEVREIVLHTEPPAADVMH